MSAHSPVARGRWLILLLASVLAIAPWIGTVAAQTSAQDAEVAQRPGDARSDWTLDLETRRAEVLWTMHRADETTREWINGSFNGLDDELSYRYTQIVDDPDGDADEVHRINLTLAIAAVYEYRDINNNSRFELSDEIIAYEPVADGGIPLIHALDYPRQIEGARAVYPLEGGGELHLEMFMSPKVDWKESRLVFPGDTELNLTVRNRPASAPGTDLAVQLRAWGGERFERTGDELTLKTGKAVGYVRWMDQSFVDGVRKPVGITTLEEKRADGSGERNEGLIIMSTDNGREITHRISVGTYVEEGPVDTILATVGDWSIYTLGLIGAGALVAIAAVNKIRERQGRQGGDGSVHDY